MLRNKKFLIVLGALILSMLVLCSCTDTELPGDDTTPEVTENTTGVASNIMDPENFEIKVVDGDVNISVIRPDELDSKSPAVIAAQNIRNGLKDLFDVAPNLDNDFKKEGDTHDAEAIEILVGPTNYDETAKVSKECPSYGDYMFQIEGNKIVVLAYSSTGYSLASNRLVSAFSEAYNPETQTITLKASTFNTTKTVDEQLSKLPVFDGGTFYSYYDAGIRLGSNTGCDEIIVKDVTTDLYDAYLTKLESSGYTKYTTNDVNGNKFATYTNDKYTINAGYYAYETAARILIEPLAPAVPRAEDNKYTKITTSQITMIGLERMVNGAADNSNGLSIVIRLEDGRFIVVDGGFNRADNAQALVKVLKDQSKDYNSGRPIVAAWIITHSHGDHSGMIAKQTSYINSNVIVEKFLANFISEAEKNRSVASNTNEDWTTGTGGQYKDVISACEKLGADMYKIHVGQVFHIADVKMEILFTLESFAPKVCNAYNTTSSVIKMTFGEGENATTYLCTGDATGNGMDIAAKTYGEAMQCDIVQICHHGYTTWGNDSGMKNGYRATNATLVLWPQGTTAFPKYVTKDYNSIVFSLSNYKECYFAGSLGDITTVPLPYVYGQTTIISPNKYK